MEAKILIRQRGLDTEKTWVQLASISSSKKLSTSKCRFHNGQSAWNSGILARDQCTRLCYDECTSADATIGRKRIAEFSCNGRKGKGMANKYSPIQDNEDDKTENIMNGSTHRVPRGHVGRMTGSSLSIGATASFSFLTYVSRCLQLVSSRGVPFSLNVRTSLSTAPPCEDQTPTTVWKSILESRTFNNRNVVAKVVRYIFFTPEGKLGI